MATDIIARGLAASALEMIAEMPNGFTNKGEVNTYADLPTSGNKVGDLYTVKTGTSTHPAGKYAWGKSNGVLIWYPVDGDNDYATQAELNAGLATKLDKITNTSSFNRVYAIDYDGNQITFDVSHNYNAQTIPRRDGRGNIRVGTAYEQTDATNKQYVDSQIELKTEIPTLVATPAMVISQDPLTIQLTAEQGAIIENDKNNFICLDATALGVGSAIFNRSRCNVEHEYALVNNYVMYDRDGYTVTKSTINALIYNDQTKQAVYSVTDNITEKDVVDGLTSESENKVLSAKQGKVLKELIDTKTFDVNIENGIGQYSLQQITDEGDENYAYGMRNFIAGGHKNKTYQRNSVAIGGGNKAGLTEEEFLEKFPGGVDYAGRPYETSYGWAFVIGADNKALANPSFALGMLNKVESVQDYALGWDNNLKGENQVSIGGYNNSYGLGNLNIGRENRIGDFIQNGVDAYEYPKYEPVNRTSNTIAIGVSNNVYADNCLITGLYNECLSGNNNIVIGEHNSCNYGAEMTLLGHGLKRSFLIGGYDGSDRCVILGTYNAQRSDTSKSGALILGCGTSDTDRKNALEVYKDGTIADGKGKINIHNLVDGEGLYSIAQKRLTSTGEESICQTYQQAGTALGGDTQVGMTENQFMEVFPSGTDSWGNTYENSYNFSFACGDQVVVKSRSSFGTGRQNTINGKAYYSAVFGDNNLVNGPYSMASGANGGILVGVRGGHIFGNGLRAVSDWETAVGKWNAAHSDILFDVGNGTSNTNRSSAFMVKNDGAVIIPYGTKGLQIGSTVITEEKLQKLLALLDTMEAQ